MKNFGRTAAFILALSAGQLSASPGGERRVIVDEARLRTMSAADQQAVLRLQQQLEKVLATDRSHLDRAERRELRSEYRSLKREMDQYNAGGTVIYLSTAGIIIILLLLIILL